MALRDKKLDATKMFLIVLVVFGHIPLLEGLIPIRQPHGYDALTWLTVHGIYAFHMPLFVFLSGLFSRKKSFQEQWNSSKKLLRLFMVFQIVDLTLSHIFAPHPFSLREFVSPCFALWYLLCLFYWRMLLSAIPSSCKPEWVMCVSVVACLAIGFVPVGNEFGLHRFFSFMPYFMFGHYYGQKMLQAIDNKVINLPPPYAKTQKLSLCLAFMVVMVVVSFNTHWLDVIILPYSSYKVFFLRIVYLCYSMFLSVAAIAIFDFKRNWENNIVAKAGSDTLFYYLMHPYILFVFVQVDMLFNDVISFIAAVCITSATIITLYLLGKIKILHSILK